MAQMVMLRLMRMSEIEASGAEPVAVAGRSRENSLMRQRLVWPSLLHIFGLLTIVSWPQARAIAAQPSPGVPAWLAAHIGEGDNQIAQPVLQRARALYLQKLSAGAVKNPCYFAMDATRPNDPTESEQGGRFYIICEADQSFHAISAGHGGGRDLEGAADFQNGRLCAKNFGSALDSNLTAGGAYVTGAATTTFKGYYRVSASQDAPFLRTFIQFDGEGETANARRRAIGGHAAATLKGICLRKQPDSPYANRDGYVPFGQFVDYTGGRSDGCTSWSPSDAQMILSIVKNDPTSLYIYPDSADVNAVARAVEAGQSPSRAGLYWNASCLQEINAPKFWSSEILEPIISRYRRDHPAPPPKPTPICIGQ
jgi:hypothetical protein